MPSVFAPGAGGDLQATNRPAAFLEMAFQLQQTELSVPAETRPNNVTIGADLEAMTATVTATLPISTALDAAGQVIVVASNYLAPLTANSGFNNGGGDLKSTHEAAAFFEIAQLLHASELLVAEDLRPNNITVGVDFEGSSATIAATLPIAAAEGAGGSIVMSAIDYLP